MQSTSTNDLAGSCEPNGGLGVFSPHPTLDDRSASLPCLLPFGRGLVRLMDEPGHGLLRGADNDANAAVSQHEGLFPSVYQHGYAPIVGVVFDGIWLLLRLPVGGYSQSPMKGEKSGAGRREGVAVQS